jgi:Spy/CpxP family protein refolding chaperone
MRVQVLTAAGALAVAGTVLVAAAAQERPRREGRPDRAAIQAELGLSADQAAQLKKLRIEGRKQAIRQHADLAIARLELAELMDAPTVDEKAVAAKVKAISDLQAAALKARTDERLAMRRLLSPEQQEKMKQLMQRNRRERGPRPGPAWRHRQPATGEAPPPPGPGGPWSDGDDGPPLPEPER